MDTIAYAKCDHIIARNHERHAVAETRVPAQTLIDYLGGGESIEDFLEGFPTISREQVIAFLEEVKERLITPKKVA